MKMIEKQPVANIELTDVAYTSGKGFDFDFPETEPSAPAKPRIHFVGNDSCEACSA